VEADEVLPASGPTATARGGRAAEGIRQAARWCLAGIMIDAVALVTDVTFRIPGLSVAGSLLQALTFGLLVWRLDSVQSRSGGTLLISLLGYSGAILAPVGLIGARLVRDLSVVVPVSVGLLGAWLIGLGLGHSRLPEPLPRRATLGGLGYLALTAWFFLAGGPLGWPLLVVGIVLGVSVLGFVFALIDLDDLAPSTAA
jgi:hypothetical protein